MDNRILEVRLKDPRLDPIETDLRIQVIVERLTQATTLRGRLLGPRCRYSTTVEIAYPMKEIARDTTAAGEHYIGLRVIIPEANFWDPISPFLYEGSLQLWEAGAEAHRRPIRWGLRAATLGLGGLRIGKQQASLRGETTPPKDEADLVARRERGDNVAVIPLEADVSRIYEWADRAGFLLVARIERPDQLPMVRALAECPSALGWLIPDRVATLPEFAQFLAQSPRPLGPWWGLELSRSLAEDPPPGVAFVYGDCQAWLEETALPALLRAPAVRDDLPSYWLGSVHEGQSTV